MFPLRTRRQFVRSLPCHLSGKPESPVVLEIENNIVGVLICLCLIQLWQLGNTCIKSKRTKMSFPLFVPPGVKDRGMLRVPLNGCIVCCTLSRPRMHAIQLGANPPRHLGIVRFLRDASFIGAPRLNERPGRICGPAFLSGVLPSWGKYMILVPVPYG